MKPIIIYKPLNSLTMHVLTVPPELFRAICNGQRSCLIVEESEEMLTNAEIEIREQTEDKEDKAGHVIVASINHIETAKANSGLKKDYALLSVSVVRHIF